MSAILIGYDLKQPGQEYEKLHKKIEELGAWWHYLDSTYIVVCAKTPQQVFDHIQPALDSSSSVLVLNVSNDAYAGWLPEDAWEWIRKNI